MTLSDLITGHYSSNWSGSPTVRHWERGPRDQLPAGFHVLEFGPTATRAAWTYATCGMSTTDDANPLEVHLLSPIASMQHVELLTVLAHYHHTCAAVHLGDSVNFGRPWLDRSLCEFGLISLPYLDGPQLEILIDPESGRTIRCLWLLPITRRERDYKASNGLEALESLFDIVGLDYLNPDRASVV